MGVDEGEDVGDTLAVFEEGTADGGLEGGSVAGVLIVERDGAVGGEVGVGRGGGEIGRPAELGVPVPCEGDLLRLFAGDVDAGGDIGRDRRGDGSGGGDFCEIVFIDGRSGRRKGDRAASGEKERGEQGGGQESGCFLHDLI